MKAVKAESVARWLLRPARRVYVGILFLMICLILFLGIKAAKDNEHKTRALAVSNCKQIELLKTEIRATITQSLKIIVIKGTAGYAYYHAHPDELRNVMTQAHQELIAFAPRACP